MYIALSNDNVISTGETLRDLFRQMLKVEINDNGSVVVNGKTDSISYNMEEFTKSESFDDFYRNRAAKLIPKSIDLYRLEPIN